MSNIQFIQISTFNGTKAYQAQVAKSQEETTFKCLSKIACKKMWSPFNFKYVINYETEKKELVTGNYRNKKTSISSRVFVMDFDEGMTLEEAIKICKVNNFQYSVLLSRNHQKEKVVGKKIKPACDRFRVIILADRLICSKTEYEQVWQYFRNIFQQKIDSQCSDTARFYFPCKEVYYENLEGVQFSVDEVLKMHQIHYQNNNITDSQTDFSKSKKGQLKQKTLNFLEKGRDADIEKRWHFPFIQATSDLRDQGYSKEEAADMLQSATKNEIGYLDSEDLKQINDIYSRPRYSAFKEDEPSDSNTAQSAKTSMPIINEFAFHGPVGDFVKSIEEQTESDPVAILIQLLCLIGNLVGRGRYMMIETTKHHMNIFVVLVGTTSGGRKGTSLSRVKNLAATIDEDWFSNCLKEGGLASGEGLIHAIRDGEEDKTTTEADNSKKKKSKDKKIDLGVTDKRLCVAESEFVSVLKVASKDGNTLSATLRNLWDSGNVSNLSKGNPQKVTGAHVSLIGHITKPELEKNLSETDISNGFVNRIIWFLVERKRILPFGGKIQSTKTFLAMDKISCAVSFGKINEEMNFSVESRDVWEKIYFEIAETTKDGLYGAATARAEPYILRLAMIYAICDLSKEIRPEHLSAAKAVWDYCDQTCQVIFGDRLGDQTVDRLLTALRKAPDGLTRTQIRDFFKKNKTSDQIERAISVLIDKKLARRFTKLINGHESELVIALQSKTSGVKNDVH